MTEAHNGNNKESRRHLSHASKDLLILVGITITIFILSYFFDIFVFLVELFKKHPLWITFIDDIITVLVTLSIGFAIFSWRRWLELKQETEERIKAQEALIKLAETKAEVERIVNKQLQHEIEERRRIEGELFKIIAPHKNKEA